MNGVRAAGLTHPSAWVVFLGAGDGSHTVCMANAGSGGVLAVGSQIARLHRDGPELGASHDQQARV
jgi:hypothetical protein